MNFQKLPTLLKSDTNQITSTHETELLILYQIGCIQNRMVVEHTWWWWCFEDVFMYLFIYLCAGQSRRERQTQGIGETCAESEISILRDFLLTDLLLKGLQQPEWGQASQEPRASCELLTGVKGTGVLGRNWSALILNLLNNRYILERNIIFRSACFWIICVILEERQPTKPPWPLPL